jgi:hypothetical protein
MLRNQTCALFKPTPQYARHNKKGGHRINNILRRPELADILLASIFA